MDKIIFDELDFIDDLKEQYTYINKEVDDYFYMLLYDNINEYLQELFDNTYENKSYIIKGVLGLWNGNEDVYSYNIYNSILDAIKSTYLNSDFYLTIKEKKYGSFIVEISHHDGVNSFEIKELTNKGYEAYNNNWNMNKIVYNKGYTKNIRYIKNYM